MAIENTRRQVDVARLRALAAASDDRIGIVSLPVDGRPRFVVDLGFATVGGAAYPQVRQSSSRLAIDLAPRHPFQPPVATVLTPVFHPHVFPSGLVCIGAKWLPSEGMDLFVLRLVRLLAFDPLLMNSHSIANAAAQLWYQATLLRHPDAFPTDAAALALASDDGRGHSEASAAAGSGAANGSHPSGQRVLYRCPHCDAALRLPAGRAGTVRCPRCTRDFEARS